MMTQRMAILLATACLALGSPARANLVQNGDFETGDLTGWTLSLVDPADAPYVGVALREAPYDYVMQFGSLQPSTLSQTLTTTPGENYTFHFDLAVEGNTDKDPTASFKVTWDGNTVMDLVDMTSHWFAPMEFTLTATGETSTLEFTSTNPVSFFSIDNVSVVPEPATWALTLSGLGAFAAFRRMQRK